MIPFVVIVPLAVASGGLLGFVQERFRRNRLAKAVKVASDTDAIEIEQASTVMSSGDLVQINNSSTAARVALGLTAIGGIFSYTPLVIISLPIIGYSTYNWMRTRYLFEKPWFKSPLSLLAILALASAMLTGHWLMAALVLSVDLASRKWIAKWTEGAHLIDIEVDESDIKEGKSLSIRKKIKYLTRIVLQGEPRWEWFPALLARVSMGLFFAISGWNKLFTVAHWKGLLSAMIATGLPFPKFMALFLASVEFYGGSLLTIGFMSTFWAIALAFAMIVAIVTVEIPFVIPPGLGPLDWLDWFLYLPQVLYVLIFLWLIIKGPGPYSVDAIIARKLGVDKDKEPEIKALVHKKTEGEKSIDSEVEKNERGGGASWSPA